MNFDSEPMFPDDSEELSEMSFILESYYVALLFDFLSYSARNLHL